MNFGRDRRVLHQGGHFPGKLLHAIPVVQGNLGQKFIQPVPEMMVLQKITKSTGGNHPAPGPREPGFLKEAAQGLGFAPGPPEGTHQALHPGPIHQPFTLEEVLQVGDKLQASLVVAQKLLESKIFLAQELARGEDFYGSAVKKLTEAHLGFKEAPP
jgi:hypothetical protein